MKLLLMFYPTYDNQWLLIVESSSVSHFFCWFSRILLTYPSRGAHFTACPSCSGSTNRRESSTPSNASQLWRRPNTPPLRRHTAPQLFEQWGSYTVTVHQVGRSCWTWICESSQPRRDRCHWISTSLTDGLLIRSSIIYLIQVRIFRYDYIIRRHSTYTIWWLVLWRLLSMESVHKKAWLVTPVYANAVCPNLYQWMSVSVHVSMRKSVAFLRMIGCMSTCLKLRYANTTSLSDFALNVFRIMRYRKATLYMLNLNVLWCARSSLEEESGKKTWAFQLNGMHKRRTHS